MSEALCNAVVSRLKATMPTYNADYFPDAPGRYPWASKDRSLLVAPDTTTFGETESIDPPSSDQQVDFSVTVIVRSLRGPAGASDTLDAVRRSLFGWRPVHSVVTPVEGGDPVTTIEPLGFRPIKPLRIIFVGEDNGTWRFAHFFRASTVAVADVSDPNLIGPPFVEAEFKEPDPE